MTNDENVYYYLSKMFTFKCNSSKSFSIRYSNGSVCVFSVKIFMFKVYEFIKKCYENSKMIIHETDPNKIISFFNLEK